ncbi:DNA gyrase C-terminal beta-propeller domain-containing protein, partial [Lactococcus hodotermopsidis]|uniref:DNA gyrase C-terminal beta-propeller domain-containing protein n=1 Tax=Pseudolactococcus hodotermopsidis TaxID=2709157 RepID=UPI001E46E26F
EFSDSEVDSDSDEDSDSEQDSNSEEYSDSEEDSISEEFSDSEEDSDSGEDSDSEEESSSEEHSDSEEDSISEEFSDSEVDSDSDEDSDSEQDSNSEEYSDSEEDSISEEFSDSDEDSDSSEDSDSEQDSNSEEYSDSEADSSSEEFSDSEEDSISEESSDSEVDSDSDEDSDSEQDSNSEEFSDSEVDSDSDEDSDSETDSSSEEHSDSEASSDPEIDLNSEEHSDSEVDFSSEKFNESDSIVGNYFDNRARNIMPNEGNSDTTSHDLPNKQSFDIASANTSNDETPTPYGSLYPIVLPRTAKQAVTTVEPTLPSSASAVEEIVKMLPALGGLFVGVGGTAAFARKRDILITISTDGYLKRSATSANADTIRNRDTITFAEKARLSDKILIFTNCGKMIYRPISEVKNFRLTENDEGQHISELTSDILPDERAIFAKIVERCDCSDNVIVATQNGLVKQIPISDLAPRQDYKKNSQEYIHLSTDDEVICVANVTTETFLFTADDGQTIYINPEDIPIERVHDSGVQIEAIIKG